ncbi:MAG TPA: FtsX-like permease family protein, partial [Terriglobia bacterium]|nr:FtsX-like permease family protein [Terriglobia bacterium]
GPRIINYLEQVLDKLDAVPGVRTAATTSSLPLEGWNEGMPFLVEGHPFVDMAGRPAANYKRVSPSYLAALQLHLLRGRWLAETDTAGNLPAIVINQPMADRYFKNEDPIGKRILIQQIIPGQPALGPEIPWQVVGIVADEKTNGQGEASPTVYVSYKQSPTTNTALVVRGAMNPSQLVKSVQSAIWELNKSQAIDGIKTLDELKSESLVENRLRTALLGAFAGLALLLAAIGVYGVISYSVTQRTHEMGVRAALGATRWDQLRLVFASGMLLTAGGLAIGVLGALGLTRLLSSFLYGVSPRDPSTLALVTVVLAAVSAAACLIPARRATRVDPMVALRHE